MDCSIKPLKYKDFFLVSTTDFFYPLVDDPYIQGKIACANVLSDLYAVGIIECDNMLMLLAESTEMNKEDRYICTKLIIQGFNDLANEAGTMVTGGQTVLNPWPIIGGVATSICKLEDIILPENAIEGDVLVLTKPLGTQVVVNLNQWKYREERWGTVKDILTKEDVERAYNIAMKSMARLNKTAAKLMHKYKAHAATDVTGFGIIGHGNNLAKNQKSSVSFEIHTLPIIKYMKEVDEKVNIFKLMKGLSAETSGGLLICLSKENAIEFCKEIEEIDGFPAWIIGNVIKSKDNDRKNNNCYLLDNLTVIPV